MSSYSIIIPSRNIDNLEACIQAIRRAGETARVIVVWDGSAAEMEDVDHSAACRWGHALLCLGAQPFCFARNVNIGIQWAGDDDVILLNDDALLLTEAGFSCMARAAEASTFWVVSPLIKGLANPLHKWGERRECEVLQRLGARSIPFVCVYIPRRVIDDVGLLDERFTGECQGHEVYGGEDDDYCLRVRDTGYHLGVYGGCVVDHGTLSSTFRPDGKGRSTAGARARFREIHGFGMGTQ